MSLFSHPIKKLTLLAAFGGGYVLGAKAGRERYEQLKQTANQVKDDPRVQQAAAQAQEFARDAAEKVKDDPRVHDVVEKVQDATKQATDKVQDVAKHAGDKASEVVGDAADTVEKKVDGDPSVSDVVDKAQDVAKQAGDKASEVVGDAADTVEKKVDTASSDVKNGTAGDSDTVHPLLADEHFESDDKVVYSAGPDIEETIDELASGDSSEQVLTDDQQGGRL